MIGIANTTDDDIGMQQLIGNSIDNSTASITTSQEEGLADSQEKLLAILPIPSAILSIVGSVTILSMTISTRKERKWTPYTRLLIGLSVCDIISSATLALAAFLRPSEDLRTTWTFGNDATCTAIGFFTQFSYSSLFYNAMLSFYFLLSARFRFKNETISRRVEPCMHFVSIVFPLVTAVVGANMGVYSTTSSELGCWVNDYPRGCLGDECLSITIGWYYFGLPFILSLISIVASNIIILVYVWKQTRPAAASQSVGITAYPPEDMDNSSVLGIPTADMDVDHDSSGENEDQLNSFVATSAYHEPDSAILHNSRHSRLSGALRNSSSEGESEGSRSFRKSPSCRLGWTRNQEKANAEKDQVRRLWLIAVQALLFVASYLLTAGWLGLLRIIESTADSPQEEIEMLCKVYPLMVCNAVMAPLQGFFNVLVFVRPKYMKWRHQFPRETRAWAMRRAVFGKRISATKRRNALGKAVLNNEINSVWDSSEKIRESDHVAEPESKEETSSEPSMTDLPATVLRPQVSTLTASLGDSGDIAMLDNDDEGNEEDDEDSCWEVILTPRPQGARNKRNNQSLNTSMSSIFNSSTSSNLDVISELEESVFEPMQTLELSSHSEKSAVGSQWTPPRILMSPELSENRWSSSPRSSQLLPRGPSITGAIVMPERYSSEDTTSLVEENSSDSDGPSDVDEKRTLPLSPSMRSTRSSSFRDDESVSSVDIPIRVPVRRPSPPPGPPLDID